MAAGDAYYSIASQTLTSDQATLDFTNISSSYTDLILVSDFILDTDGNNLYYKFNSSTASDYNENVAYGTNGSSEAAASLNSQDKLRMGYWTTTGTQVQSIIQVFNYADTGLWKHISMRYGSLEYCDMRTENWRSTSAVTSINILCTGSTKIKSGSTFSLYGISRA